MGTMQGYGLAPISVLGRGTNAITATMSDEKVKQTNGTKHWFQMGGLKVKLLGV
jgi:hypothetical protein